MSGDCAGHEDHTEGAHLAQSEDLDSPVQHVTHHLLRRGDQDFTCRMASFIAPQPMMQINFMSLNSFHKLRHIHRVLSHI